MKLVKIGEMGVGGGRGKYHILQHGTKLYRAFIKILDGRGILLAIANDVKICSPPSTLAEIVGKLPALAMSEAGLTTQASKNIVYVQPSAKATWTTYLDSKP